MESFVRAFTYSKKCRPALKSDFHISMDGIKLTTIQCAFINIASPSTKTSDETLQCYDENYGLPSEEMMQQFKAIVRVVAKMKTCEDMFEVSFIFIYENFRSGCINRSIGKASYFI